MYPISLFLYYDDDTSPLEGEVDVSSPEIKWSFASVSANKVGEMVFCDFQARS